MASAEFRPAASAVARFLCGAVAGNDAREMWKIRPVKRKTEKREKSLEKGVDKGEEVWYTSEAVPENGQRDLEN